MHPAVYCGGLFYCICKGVADHTVFSRTRVRFLQLSTHMHMTIYYPYAYENTRESKLINERKLTE